MKLQVVVIDPTGHHVADKHVVAVICRPEVIGIIDHAVDGGRSVGMLHQNRGKAQAVMRLAKAGIISAGQQLINRSTVTVTGVEVSTFIPGEAKRGL